MTDTDKGVVYVLDTNVVVDDPDAIYGYGKREQDLVVLPDIVLSELDRLKREDHTSANARRVSAKLMRLSDQEPEEHAGVIDRGDLMKGVRLGIKERDAAGVVSYRRGGTLQLYSGYRKETPRLEFAPELGKDDLDIVRACLKLQAENDGKKVVLITGDKNLVITARANSLHAEHREGENLSTDNLYSGYELVNNPILFATLSGLQGAHKDKFFPIARVDEEWVASLVGNQYLIFTDEGIAKKIADGKPIDTRVIYRYDPVARGLRGIAYDFKHSFDKGELQAQNMQQMLSLDSLLSDEIRLTMLLGVAGGGKTFLALAAALYKIRRHRSEAGDPTAKIYIVRRDEPMAGENMGFLPGGEIDKLGPKNDSIASNWQKLTMMMGISESYGLTLDEALRDPNSVIGLKYFGNMRGTSFGTNDIVIVEEAQNFHPREMQSLITRIGEGEIYLTGDVYQVDNPRVRPEFNGANFLVDRIVKTRDNPDLSRILSTVTMRICERSKLATWGGRYLR